MKQIRVRRSWATRGAELHRVEVAERDAPLGERLVELDQQRLVLGADRADQERRGPSWSVQGPTYCDRVGADRRPGQRPRRSSPGRGRSPGRRARAGRRAGRGEQRVDVDLADPGLLDDQPAEPDEQLLQGREVDRPAGRGRPSGPCRSGSAPSSGGPASCSAAAGPAPGP